MTSFYYDIFNDCIIFLTLLITETDEKKCFLSKLQIIKNYLRKPLLQDRFTNISLLNIERNRTKECNLDQIVNAFANKVK